MTTACVIAAVLIVVGALVAVAADFHDERDWHAANAEQLAAQLDAANARLEEIAEEHANCPAPVTVRIPPVRVQFEAVDRFTERMQALARGQVPPQRDGSAS